MKSKSRKRFAVSIILLMVFIVILDNGANAADKKPNILYILADDLGYADVGANGWSELEFKTPHIDSIFSGGVRFRAGYVSNSVCAPSRAGLLTGRSGSRFGFDSNIPHAYANKPGSTIGLDPKQKTIADMLKKVGYKTYAIGKWHLGDNDGLFHPNRRGFDEFYGLIGGSRSYFQLKKYDHGQSIEHNGTWVKEPEDIYVTDFLTDKALDFISDQAANHPDQPWFMYMSYTAPHAPMHAKPEDIARVPLAHHFKKASDNTQRQIYAAMVLNMDDNIGRLIDKLDELGIADDTLIVFHSDNGGPMVGKNWSINYPLTGGKGSLWEGGIRVPFAMRWTGTIPSGQVLDQDCPVSSLDMMPMFASISGADQVQDIVTDGVDLMPLLTKKITTLAPRKLFWRRDSKRMIAIRSGDWKYYHDRETGETYLFDLSSGSKEADSVNRAASKPDILARLQGEYADYEAALPDPAWSAWGDNLGPLLAVTTYTLDDAVRGRPYSMPLTCSNTPKGGPVTWSIVSGKPDWLSIDSAAGLLSGTPPMTAAGADTIQLQIATATDTSTYKVSLRVKDADDDSDKSKGKEREGVAPEKKLNVVLIVCDDLNDYITGIPGQTGHPQARTPHVEKLAESGVAFRRAYSNNPVCAPSRSSFLTGIYPHTSGNLFWDKWFYNPVLKNSRTMMEHFHDNGYHVVGSGKLMHHFKKAVWDEFEYEADYGPFVYDGKERVAHPSVPEPYRSIGAVDGSYAPLSDVPYADDDDPNTGWIYGDWDNIKPLKYRSEEDRDPTPDERNANWAAAKIREFSENKQDKPFFLGVGFIRPHTPLHVPKKYFDLFPLDSVKRPVIKSGDASDTHYADVFDEDVKGLRYFRTLNESYQDPDTAIKTFTRAYLACVTAVDDCIGQVVAAVDNSCLQDNTIIVLVSDHGWQMGQKDYLFKNSPWEESIRIPFVIRAPGVTKAGGVAEHPISLIDLYPTLVDLCGLTGDTRKNANGAKLDGFSVRPFLEDPACDTWQGPEGALTMVYAGENSKQVVTEDDKKDPARQHWSLRTRRWRYIRYNNGSEELYDHQTDPHEWNNLAGDPTFQSVKDLMIQELKSMVPRLPGRF